VDSADFRGEKIAKGGFLQKTVLEISFFHPSSSAQSALSAFPEGSTPSALRKTLNTNTNA